MSDLERVLRKLARLLQPPEDQATDDESRVSPPAQTDPQQQRPPQHDRNKPGAAA